MIYQLKWAFEGDSKAFSWLAIAGVASKVVENRNEKMEVRVVWGFDSVVLNLM